MWIYVQYVLYSYIHCLPAGSRVFLHFFFFIFFSALLAEERKGRLWSGSKHGGPLYSFAKLFPASAGGFKKLKIYKSKDDFLWPLLYSSAFDFDQAHIRTLLAISLRFRSFDRLFRLYHLANCLWCLIIWSTDHACWSFG